MSHCFPFTKFIGVSACVYATYGDRSSANMKSHCADLVDNRVGSDFVEEKQKSL